MSLKTMQVNPKNFDKSHIKFYAFLIPMSIFMLLPIIYTLNQAFKPLDELFLFPPTFFVQKPTLQNFTDLFRAATNTGVPMTRYLFNSIVITVVAIALTLIITTSTGYALSKKKFVQTIP